MLHQRTKGLDKIGLQQSAVLIIVMLKGSRNNIEYRSYLKEMEEILGSDIQGAPIQAFQNI